MDQPKKDGDVLVPGPSRIFEWGGDAVAYASFKHQQEAARMAREAAAFQCRQLQQKKSEAKAVQALKIRKSLGGTLRMTPKPAVPASIFNVPGTAPMPEGRGSRQQYRGGMRAEEAEKLMKSKSKHSAEARSVSRVVGSEHATVDRCDLIPIFLFLFPTRHSGTHGPHGRCLRGPAREGSPRRGAQGALLHRHHRLSL